VDAAYVPPWFCTRQASPANGEARDSTQGGRRIDNAWRRLFTGRIPMGAEVCVAGGEADETTHISWNRKSPRGALKASGGRSW
jgi:hypothetical protein